MTIEFDLGITCREPLSLVTGGIGTYTRLLVDNLAKKGLKLAVFVPEDSDTTAVPSSVTVVHVPLQPTDIFNNINSSELRYAHSLFTAVRIFCDNGNSFRLFETPDYGAEGYFVNFGKVYGLLPIHFTAIRLHSPHFMLHDDNELNQYYIGDDRVCRAEKDALLASDIVLYGGDSMRDRVLSYLSPKELSIILPKLKKIWHPFPTFSLPVKTPPATGTPTEFNVGCIGRLEWRKGWDLLIKGFSRCAYDPAFRSFRFHVFGGDTDTAHGASMRSYLEGIIPPELSERFSFYGRLPQAELNTSIQNMDAFIFPSRFENFPNALLETLHLQRPTLVSSSGCMAEIGSKFPWVQPFDPRRLGSYAEALRWLTDKSFARHDISDTVSSINEDIAQRYQNLHESPAPSIRQHSGCSIIVPHLNDSENVESLAMSNHNYVDRIGEIEIVVIDDGSKPEHLDRLNSLATNGHIKLIFTDQPFGGPSIARLKGLVAASYDFIAFVDADDYIDIQALERILLSMSINKFIDVTCGAMKCFGIEKHSWMPSPPTAATVLFENFTHVGIVSRKETLSKVDFVAPGELHHDEDWLMTAQIVFDTKNTIFLYPDIYYYYNRTNPASRSLLFDNFRRDSHALRLDRMLDALLFSAGVVQHRSDLKKLLARAVVQSDSISVLLAPYPRLKSFLSRTAALLRAAHLDHLTVRPALWLLARRR
ncbi:MAG: glycosyltransferase [Mesorhizobium sp.]|uniref:glycosyltransferase n=1 Tax=Mesorhizobium sp. TaxID=1871066 RepID=UPI001AD45B92|nr:glycosyltransferase [Mesorhizobium sp.]MBN9220056.1 glycosyltransferase [Mesorhizobium sp.]